VVENLSVPDIAGSLIFIFSVGVDWRAAVAPSVSHSNGSRHLSKAGPDQEKAEI
jgi:hypothetical protein